MYLSIRNFIDSIFRSGKNYYPQVFSEQSEYVVEERKGCLSILLTKTHITHINFRLKKTKNDSKRSTHKVSKSFKRKKKAEKGMRKISKFY